MISDDVALFTTDDGDYLAGQPLAATGILVQEGDAVLAEGSLLLFLTNLLAIVVSALLIGAVTGQAGPPRDVVLANATGLKVAIADDPLTCVARGTSVYLENLELWKDTLESDDANL